MCTVHSDLNEYARKVQDSLLNEGEPSCALHMGILGIIVSFLGFYCDLDASDSTLDKWVYY